MTECKQYVNENNISKCLAIFDQCLQHAGMHDISIIYDDKQIIHMYFVQLHGNKEASTRMFVTSLLQLH